MSGHDKYSVNIYWRKGCKSSSVQICGGRNQVKEWGDLTEVERGQWGREYIHGAEGPERLNSKGTKAVTVMLSGFPPCFLGFFSQLITSLNQSQPQKNQGLPHWASSFLYPQLPYDWAQPIRMTFCLGPSPWVLMLSLFLIPNPGPGALIPCLALPTLPH